MGYAWMSRPAVPLVCTSLHSFRLALAALSLSLMLTLALTLAFPLSSPALPLPLPLPTPLVFPFPLLLSFSLPLHSNCHSHSHSPLPTLTLSLSLSLFLSLSFSVTPKLHPTLTFACFSLTVLLFLQHVSFTYLDFLLRHLPILPSSVSLPTHHSHPNINMRTCICVRVHSRAHRSH